MVLMDGRERRRREESRQNVEDEGSIMLLLVAAVPEIVSDDNYFFPIAFKKGRIGKPCHVGVTNTQDRRHKPGLDRHQFRMHTPLFSIKWKRTPYSFIHTPNTMLNRSYGYHLLHKQHDIVSGHFSSYHDGPPPCVYHTTIDTSIVKYLNVFCCEQWPLLVQRRRHRPKCHRQTR